MPKRNNSLVVDTNQWEVVKVETGVPQGSSASPLLFAIYLSRIFQEGKEEVEGCKARFFVDFFGWLLTEDSVAKLWQWIARAGIKAWE